MMTDEERTPEIMRLEDVSLSPEDVLRGQGIAPERAPRMQGRVSASRDPMNNA